jgi:hypothetical protein
VEVKVVEKNKILDDKIILKEVNVSKTRYSWYRLNEREGGEENGKQCDEISIF